MYKNSKKLAAAILAAALALSSVSTAFAAKSPTNHTPKPGKQQVKSKAQSTIEVLVDKDAGVTATKVANVKIATVGGNVKVKTIKGDTTTNVPVDTLGTKALDGNKKTTKLTTTKTVTTIKSKAIVGSKVETVVSIVKKHGKLVLKSESLADNSSLKTFEAKGDGSVEFGRKTFDNTSISSVTVKCGKVTFKQGAFVGIKKGTRTQIFLAGLRDVNKLKVEKGAFGSNSKNMVVRFSTNLTKKEFRKASKILRDGGFKGQIISNRILRLRN